MLTRPAPAVLIALTALRNHTEWQEVTKFLEQELTALQLQLIEAVDETTLRQFQGRAKCIKEFLALVRPASA